MAIPILAQLAVGLISVGISAKRKSDAKKKMEDLPDDNYNIPRGYFDNLQLAQSEAQYGISPSTLNKLQEQYSSALASTNANILQGGGGVNDIAKLYGGYTDAMTKIGVEDDMLRSKKIENLLQANSTIAGQNALMWKLNVYDKIRNERALLSGMINEANEGINSGLNLAIGAGLQGGDYLKAKIQNNKLEKINKDNNSNEEDDRGGYF